MNRRLKSLLKVATLSVVLTSFTITSASATENVSYGVKVLEDTLGIVVSVESTDIDVSNAMNTYTGSTSITVENAGTGSLELTSRVDTTSGSFSSGDLTLVDGVPSVANEVGISLSSKQLTDIDKNIKTLGFDWDAEKGETSVNTLEFKLGNNTPTGSYVIPVVFTASR